MNTVIQVARPALPQSPDYPQAARYLGVHTENTDTRRLLEGCAPALWSAAQPRAAWVWMPISALEQWSLGTDLETHLSGCHTVCLLAVTLGSGVDGLLRRLSATDVAKAAITDSLASTLIEQVSNELEKTLRTEVEKNGGYLTGRFSPGYGDSSLELQPRICALLDTNRKIGLSATETLLLTPRKSITAFMGMADHPVTGKLAGCAHCTLKDKCSYRKRGKTCAAE